jgi:hypothetical protein
MAGHEHGKMDISVQEKTFAGFMTFATRVGAFCIVLLIFIALVNG